MNSNSNRAAEPHVSGQRSPLALLQSNRVFWGLTIVLLVTAVVSRFWGLAEKPFHHDESLHAYYSHAVANGGVHKYDALLHGPFLYYFVGMFQFVAKLWNGDTSDFVARFPAALFGVLVVASPLLILRLVGRAGTVILMGLLLLSPTTWYFGRFLREDVFTSVWVLGTLFGIALAGTMPDDRPVNGTLRIPGLGYKLQLGEWLPGTPKTVAWCFATSMLAFHFTNKENSYLHTMLWLMAAGLIWFFARSFRIPQRGPAPALAGEPMRRVAWCFGAFSFIFVVLYSGFFRHPDGSWNGVIDGLYRKSIVYWWGQDQQRRIDGPFDYHLPLIANYEFLLLPFLAVAWFRALALSRRMNELIQSGIAKGRIFFASQGVAFWLTIGICVGLIASTFLLPRMALVSESCSIVDIPCAANTPPRSCHGIDKPWACLLHISHSRHLLQIVSYLFAGALAFLAMVHARRNADAFLWFWFTGAIGTYSYVGEKVPWLAVYVVLPLLLIAGLELIRLVTANDLPVYDGEPGFAEVHERFTHSGLVASLLWLGFAVPFTAWKGWRVAFPNAANPEERLVFTQTTPEIKMIRDRMQHAASLSPEGNVRVGMEGEATWPFAWYVQTFSSFDFLSSKGTRLADIKARAPFDALFLNDSSVDEVHRALPGYQIYRVPLRAWWVPKPNPTVPQILEYFIFGRIYPSSTHDAETGKGATQVLYLENMSQSSPFAELPSLPFGELVFSADLNAVPEDLDDH